MLRTGEQEDDRGSRPRWPYQPRVAAVQLGRGEAMAQWCFAAAGGSGSRGKVSLFPPLSTGMGGFTLLSPVSRFSAFYCWFESTKQNPSQVPYDCDSILAVKFHLRRRMAAKPLTTEAIALTEKKMDMTLDDIIKMAKNKNTKGSKQKRVLNKSQKFSNRFTQDKSSKVRSYMDSRSSLRQGALAKRRSNFQGNQFPVATEVARKAVTAPLHSKIPNRNRVANWNKARFRVPASQRRAAGGGFAAKQSLPPPQKPQENGDIMPKQKPHTLDSLFANMTEQRLRVLSMRNNAVQRNGGGNRRLPWGRGRFGN